MMSLPVDNRLTGSCVAAGDHREIQGREAAARFGQNQVPGTRPRQHERAGEDHQVNKRADRRHRRGGAFIL